jgi:hypothetical protein
MAVLAETRRTVASGAMQGSRQRFRRMATASIHVERLQMQNHEESDERSLNASVVRTKCCACFYHRRRWRCAAGSTFEFAAGTLKLKVRTQRAQLRTLTLLYLDNLERPWTRLAGTHGVRCCPAVPATRATPQWPPGIAFATVQAGRLGSTRQGLAIILRTGPHMHSTRIHARVCARLEQRICSLQAL